MPHRGQRGEEGAFLRQGRAGAAGGAQGAQAERGQGVKLRTAIAVAGGLSGHLARFREGQGRAGAEIRAIEARQRPGGAGFGKPGHVVLRVAGAGRKHKREGRKDENAHT